MSASRVVLQICFGAARGGLERDARAMIEHAGGCRHQVLILGDTGQGPMRPVWEQAGAEVHWAGRGSGRIDRVFTAVRRQLRDRPADGVIAWFGLPGLPQIIHACNTSASAGGLARTPLLVHGGNPAGRGQWKTDLRYRLLARMYPPRGPLPIYVCCSRYVADSLARSSYLSRFATRVVYNGIEMPDVVAAPRRLFDEQTDRGPVIGMTARLSEIKDHRTLLRAFTKLLTKWPTATLELLGDGPMRDELVALAEKLGIGPRVTFHGGMRDVYSVMRHWDLFAYATTAQEGLGNAVSEALALQLPVVLTEVGPTAEFCETEAGVQTVCLVPPGDPDALGDAVDALLGDDARRRQMAAAGGRMARRRFDPQHFALQHCRLLGFQKGLDDGDKTWGLKNAMSDDG